MKKYLLLVIAMIGMLFGGLSKVQAQEVTIYFFRGYDCPHCEDSLDFINNNKDKIDSRIKIVTYEVWKNKNNEKLHQAVADKLEVPETKKESVPFIVVGNTYQVGMDGTLNDFNEMLEMAKKYLDEEEEYTDIVKLATNELKKENKDIKLKSYTLEQLYADNKVASYIVFGVFGVLVISFIGFIVFSRKN